MAELSPEAALDSAIASMRMSGLKLSLESEALLRQSVAERWPQGVVRALLIAEAQGRPFAWPGEIPREEWARRWAEQATLDVTGSLYGYDGALAVLDKMDPVGKQS